MNIRIKHALDKIEAADGVRVLVDETLPSGYDEYKLHIDMWPKEIVPSNRLKKLLNEHPEKWDEFEEGYMKELDKEKDLWVGMILEKARVGTVTLLYSSGTPQRNFAVVVKDYILASREEFLQKAA